ncbi:MAG TPA: hypothetical protein VGH23_04220 [Rhizomicrobium sp.]
MPNQKQHQGIDQICDVLVVGIAREDARACPGLAIAHDHDSLSPDGESGAFDIVPVGEFLIYAIRRKRNADHFRVFGCRAVSPIRVQCKRKIERPLIIGVERDADPKQNDIAVNLALIAWHALPVC